MQVWDIKADQNWLQPQRGDKKQQVYIVETAAPSWGKKRASDAEASNPLQANMGK